jgi:transposase
MNNTATTLDHLTGEVESPTDTKKAPFAKQLITITKQQDIEQRRRINYLQAQQVRSSLKITELERKIARKDARIKDLENRLFGKKSEKNKKFHSEKGDATGNGIPQKRKRGQQKGTRGHGRTQRPNLPVIYDDSLDLVADEKKCPICGLEHRRDATKDKQTDVIEVEVRAYTRRYSRPAYKSHPECQCDHKLPAVITTPPPPQLIPNGSYGVTFWTEIILSKFLYGQPTHRCLKDLNDLGLPVSEGTVAGGLQNIASVFEPIEEAFYVQQMNEDIFHNDESRWEVFAEVEGKIGHRWYLWVTRSQSVIFYNIDPSRSAAVPGAHFAGLQGNKAIIVCDRYSSYKKLARLAEGMILLAFCWAHVRRDFLDAGRGFDELESWSFDWREKIGNTYYINKLRLEHWDPKRSLEQQSKTFNQHHLHLKETLKEMHNEATEFISKEEKAQKKTASKTKKNAKKTPQSGFSKAAKNRQKKVYQSLINHWSGLEIFVENPAVPMDNNLAENAIRGPVVGRKNYYGSGSIWSAMLAAVLFSILQTLVALWGINPRHWMMDYLDACAKNGGQAPKDLTPFIPWLMNQERLEELTRPYFPQAPPVTIEPHPIS